MNTLTQPPALGPRIIAPALLVTSLLSTEALAAPPPDPAASAPVPAAEAAAAPVTAPAPAIAPDPEPESASALEPGPTSEAAPPPTLSPAMELGAAGPQPADIPETQANPNRGLGLTVVGFSAFGVTYAISAIVGGSFIDGDSGYYDPYYDETVADGPMVRVGRGLLIPGVGPFVAASASNSYALGAGLVFNGVVQLGALAMGITGAVRLGNARRQARLSASGGGLKLQF